MNRKEVTRVIESHRQEIMDRFPVKSLYLFGSTARDQAGPESDVDLLVEFSKPVGLFEFIELQQTLETILGCKVDLGTRRSIKLHLRDQVLQEAIRVA
jgi:predicted nucleotidyltransferase